jgi:hypothetical protein
MGKNKIGYWMKTTWEYFSTSLFSLPTWILIFFNGFLFYSLSVGKFGIGEVMLTYVFQGIIFILFLCVNLFCVRSFVFDKKRVRGKDAKVAMIALVLFILTFYGVAVSMMTIRILDYNISLGVYFFWGVGLLFVEGIMFFVFNFKKESKRLEKANFSKVFFEPMTALFPVYLGIFALSLFQGEFAGIVIVAKTLGDIIISSPLNSEEPFINKVLTGS